MLSPRVAEPEGALPAALDSERPSVIELGVIIAGPLDAVDRRAVDHAVADAIERLSDDLPEFDWRISQIRRDEWASTARVEPAELLQQARDERDEQGWDFAFVFTASDLVSHYKPFALAVISSALDVAVVSTSRIDPRATMPEAVEHERLRHMEQRVVRLMLHSLGHWLGLAHHGDEDNVMSDIASVEQLSRHVPFTAAQRDEMKKTLVEIADQRLEEREDAGTTSLPKFYLLAAWENRGEIVESVLQARPWEFPTRLSRFTTAAVSTVLVLLMTAETWDMAMSQTWISVLGLFAFAMTGTTGYIAIRQQLLLRRNGRRISEQIVTSNVSATAIVATGMLVMFLLLTGLTALAGWLMFPSEVVNGWAASLGRPAEPRHYALMATTVASLGILIGALGASFEQQHHFRHVVFVDEEV